MGASVQGGWPAIPAGLGLSRSQLWKSSISNDYPATMVAALSLSPYLQTRTIQDRTPETSKELRAPSLCAKTHKHSDPLISFHPRCQNFFKQVQPGARQVQAGLAPPSLTLSRQLTFSVGYTTFPQRAHWGFIVAVPAGGGCCGGCGWGLRGASVTSPGKPNAASGQAGGRRAPGSGGGRWPGGERAAAGAKVGAQRGLAPGADRAFRHSGAGARLWLGFRAAGSASFALQVPVTHRHSRPPLALTRSPPPPPPRRPNPPARPDRSGSERARRAPREGGRGGVGGTGRAGTWSLQAAAGGDSVAWERASRGSRRSLGAQAMR
ncbi:uncharacterized protein LOC120887480 [Ictidomys tridecemlineatus]